MNELMQDYNYKLFKWFASKPDARRLVRERALEIQYNNQRDFK